MSNMLLKTLEEPPPYTILILLANHMRLILPTILSRCQLIRFNPLPIPWVAQWLRERQGLEEGEAHLFASLSEGSPGKALEIEKEIREMSREELLKGLIGENSLSAERMQSWVKSLPTQERERLILVLEVAKTLLRDMIIVKTLKEGSNIIHSDLLRQIKTLTLNWKLSSLLKRMEILHQTTFAIRNNANTELALEAMMLSWAKG
jgi:DNA polymerase-3 subunit delta'